MGTTRRIAAAAVAAAVVILALLAVGGCTAGGPEAAARQILDLEREGRFDESYALLHPDLQAQVTVAEYVAAKRASFGPLVIANREVGKARILERWTFEAQQMTAEYTDVAEVPFVIWLRAPDGSEKAFDQTLHLARAADGTWRFFWLP